MPSSHRSGICDGMEADRRQLCPDGGVVDHSFTMDQVFLDGRDLTEAMAELRTRVRQAETPEQRVARILTDAGWTDAALGAGESE